MLYLYTRNNFHEDINHNDDRHRTSDLGGWLH
jgi:hypothetical protein